MRRRAFQWGGEGKPLRGGVADSDRRPAGGPVQEAHRAVRAWGSEKGTSTSPAWVSGRGGSEPAVSREVTQSARAWACQQCRTAAGQLDSSACQRERGVWRAREMTRARRTSPQTQSGSQRADQNSQQSTPTVGLSSVTVRPGSVWPRGEGRDTRLRVSALSPVARDIGRGMALCRQCGVCVVRKSAWACQWGACVEGWSVSREW